MISVSNEYKKAMSRPNRNRAFISVGIGIINQNAQEDGKAQGDFAYWSYGNVFNSNQIRVEYATLEENFMKADGNMIFMPENDELMQLNYNGITTDDVLGAIRIDFSEIYSIKGITLVFGSAYPTEFTIETAEKTLTYENSSKSFVTNDVLGDTNYIIVTPISMVGGQQRFRLQSVLMGVGLQYSNAQTKSFSHDDFVSSISDELPSEKTQFAFYDENGLFNVDDDSSFIDYLETMQKITVSFGLELDNGTVEWHQVATNYLKDWKSQKGIVTLSATDRLSQMEDEYSLGNKIYTRTAYQEAESIFADAGLQPDEYFIDDYLNDVTLTNPMPVGTHKACLQLLANACRCIIRQNENGRIMIQANFATVLDPDDLTVTTNGVTEWSKPDNVLIGSGIVYAELNKDFLKADGTMYFMPEDVSYLETSYVSEQVADENGIFNKNILPNNYYASDIFESGGLTYTKQSDGTMLINGTSTAISYYRYAYANINQDFLKSFIGKMVTIHHEKTNKNIRYTLQFLKDGTQIMAYNAINYAVTFEVPEHDEIRIFLRIASGVTLTNDVASIQIEVGEKATGYMPYQKNPTITIAMPASYAYFGVNVDFAGNPPSEMTIHTYKADEHVESVAFKGLSKSSSLMHEFKSFDKMVFEVTKGYPLNRVLVDKISFGSLSDYVLTRTNMMENPIGYKEQRVKVVKVKIYTFQNNEDGEPEEVKDNVFANRVINDVGEPRTLKNPLVSTQEHAEILAEWLGNYYGNNISYEVNYRGEPRIGGADIIHMESEKKSNLQVEVTRNKLSFNGAFSGSLELRRALKMMGG